MNDQEADRLIHSDDPGSIDAGLRFLREQAEANPDDAERWFIYGGGLDFSDRPEEAIVAYGRVFDLGVDQLLPEDQPRIYIQAGSTLRNLGRLNEARTLLEEGIRRYPRVRALPVFLALVEVSAGNEQGAIDLLFEALLAEGNGDDSIQTYRRALAWYAGEIRESRC